MALQTSIKEYENESDYVTFAHKKERLVTELPLQPIEKFKQNTQPQTTSQK
jgi:hypothetical protein